jgi:hypothetical protein
MNGKVSRVSCGPLCPAAHFNAICEAGRYPAECEITGASVFPMETAQPCTVNLGDQDQRSAMKDMLSAVGKARAHLDMVLVESGVNATL